MQQDHMWEQFWFIHFRDGLLAKVHHNDGKRGLAMDRIHQPSRQFPPIVAFLVCLYVIHPCSVHPACIVKALILLSKSAVKEHFHEWPILCVLTEALGRFLKLLFPALATGHIHRSKVFAAPQG